MKWHVALLLLAANAALGLTVRIESPNGAPRIVVNGQPVRARMFWGAPGAAPVPVANDWQPIDFEFIATESATNGTMHFRFGKSTGEVELRDITVSSLGGGPRSVVAETPADATERVPPIHLTDWVVWPPDMAGAVRQSNGTVRVVLSTPKEGFHIYSRPNLTITAGQHYRVSLFARATPVRSLNIAFYRPGHQYVRLGGPPDVFQSQIKLAANVGVDFVSFPIGLPWPKPGEPADWAGVDAACELVLRANPNALLLPRVPLDPPPWWREAHPDDVMQWDDGHRAKAVPASPRYRQDAAERLTALIEHLEKKFGDHIAGYHPNGQNTGEWFYEDTWKRPLNGYAPADLAAWQRWRKDRPVSTSHKKGTIVPSLWPERGGAATVTTEANMPVPTPAERRSTNVLASATVVDWARFQQEAMADCVCALARAARKATRGRKLVVFFYGYVFEFGPVANGPATSGHYALRRVLNCRDIDVLCSPISYFDRGLGQSAPSMTAAESVALGGKLWLNEDDTHTYLATGDPPGSRDHVTTLAESNAELVRNVAQEALRNFGTWWMDLGASGWFNDAGMWAEMKRLEKLDDYFLKKPTPFRPEVAVVIDEQSMWRIAPGGVKYSRQNIYQVREPLGRMGAPYGQYLLDDVLARRARAKLYVFVNGWQYSPEERAKLARTVRGQSLFVETTGVTSAMLREAARAAGVHLFTETDCNVYANGRSLALHAAQDGPLTVNTGFERPVTDALTGDVVGQGPKLTLPIKRGETRVLSW